MPDRNAQVAIGVPAVIQFHPLGGTRRTQDRREFRQHGRSGQWVSELFPHVAQLVDDLCFVKSLHGTNEAHGGALLALHTGSGPFARPSRGAWTL